MKLKAFIGVIFVSRACIAAPVPDSPAPRHLQGPVAPVRDLAPVAARVHELWQAADQADATKQFGAELGLLRELDHLAPNDFRVYSRLGLVCVSLGDRAGAIAAFGKAAQVRPDDPGLAANLGGALLEAGRVDEADQWAAPWRARAGESVELALLLAKIDLAKHRVREAQRFLVMALAGKKHLSAEAALDVGLLLREVNDDSDAEVALRTCLELDPRSSPARLQLASILRSSSRLEEAEQLVNHEAARHPDDAAVLWERANIHAARGRLEHAVRDFDRVYSINPAKMKAAYLAATCLVDLLRPADALTRLKMLLGSSRSIPPDVKAEADQLRRSLEARHEVDGTPNAAPQAADHALGRALAELAKSTPRLEWVPRTPGPDPADRAGAVRRYGAHGSVAADPCEPGFSFEVNVLEGTPSARDRDTVCDAPREEGPKPGWFPQIEREITTIFPEAHAAIGWRTITGRCRFNEFDALAEPRPGLWVRIKGRGDAPGTSTELMGHVRKLVDGAWSAGPAGALPALTRLSDSGLVRGVLPSISFTLAEPDRSSTFIHLVVYPDWEELAHDEYPVLLDGRPRRIERAGVAEEQRVIWLGGTPVVFVGSRDANNHLARMNDLFVVIAGRYEIRINPPFRASDDDRLSIVKSIVFRLFPDKSGAR